MNTIIKKTININNLSTPVIVAVLSFFIGTSFFCMYMITPSECLIIIGLLYVMIAAFFNIITLIYLIHQLLCTSKPKLLTCFDMLIVLSNIPIALFYLYIVISKFI